MEQRIKTKWGDAVLCADGYYKISNKNTKYGGKLLHRLIYAEHHQLVLDSNIIIHHINFKILIKPVHVFPHHCIRVIHITNHIIF